MTEEPTHPPDPGDLGRRVAARRRELGLSVEEVAEQAGMAPGYLRRVEQSGEAVLNARALGRLAGALGTTSADLLGAGFTRPPGAGRARGDVQLVPMTEDECWQRLAPGGVGRLVFDAERGPVALPANFALDGHKVVVRTGPGTPFDGLGNGEVVGFEVDRIDETFREGWSVLASGHIRRPEPAERQHLASLGVTPWLPERDEYLVIDVTDITGRRIEARR